MHNKWVGTNHSGEAKRSDCSVHADVEVLHGTQSQLGSIFLKAVWRIEHYGIGLREATNELAVCFYHGGRGFAGTHNGKNACGGTHDLNEKSVH